MSKITEQRKRFPLKVKDEAIRDLAALPQFREIHTVTLIRLAHRRTGLFVPSRWVAISLLRSNLGPIPVPNLKERPKAPTTKTTAPPKLKLIHGGKRIVR